MVGVANVDFVFDVFAGKVFFTLDGNFADVERDEVPVFVEPIVTFEDGLSGSFSHCSIGDVNIVICHDLSFVGHWSMASTYNLIYR
jgi:hypothetical protein